MFKRVFSKIYLERMLLCVNRSCTAMPVFWKGVSLLLRCQLGEYPGLIALRSDSRMHGEPRVNGRCSKRQDTQRLIEFR